MSDKPPEDKDGPLELLKKLWLPVAGFVGAIILIVNFIQLWRGDQTTVTYIAAGGGLVILVIALGWVGFKTKEVEVKTVATREDQIETTRLEKQPAYLLKYQRLARGGLLLILIGIIFGANSLIQQRLAKELELQTQATLSSQTTQTADRAEQLQATQGESETQQAIQTQQVQATQYAQATAQAQQESESKLIVVIATFEGPEEVYGLRNEIIESLNSSFSQDEEVEILTVKDIITPDMGSSFARKLGDQYFADLVIWGWYRPTENPNITIHIENLSPTQFERLQESKTYKPKASIAQLESFEIQRQLGSETSTLISFLIGTLKFKSNDHNAAIENFEQVLSQNDVSTLVSHFDLLFNLGYSYNEIGDYAKSVQYWDKAMGLDPENAWVYNNRGYDYYLLGKYEQAIQDYDKAIKLNPEFTFAYGNRGYAYFVLGEYERAIQDYNKAIEIDPQSVIDYNNRGYAYHLLGEYRRAIQDYDKAIDLNPEYQWAYYNRGLAYAFLEEYDRAIQDYDKAIELDPKDAAAYNDRGNCYQYLGQYERAIQDFDRAIELDPEYAIAFSNRGNAYSDLGDYERAMQDYDKAIKLDPQYANTYYNRGLAYQKLGKTAEAEADFKKYEELTGQKP